MKIPKEEIVWNIQELDEVDSTNDFLLESSRKGAKQGTVIYADSQKKGRGRFGRIWHSPKGEGLYFSYLLKPELAKDKLHLLSLASGLGVAEGLNEFCNTKNKTLALGLKWPNDIRISKKKVGGILCEIEIDRENNTSVIVGIGINTNMIINRLPENLQNITTSLKNEGLGMIENKKLLYILLQKQKELYNELKNFGFENILERWMSFCDSLGEEVLMKGGKIKGKIIKINSKGHLVVKRDDGEILEIFSSEII